MPCAPLNDISIISSQPKEEKQELKLLVQETAHDLIYRISGGFDLIQEDEELNLWIRGGLTAVRKNLSNIIISVASERANKLRKITVKTGIMNSGSECLEACRARQELGEGNYAFLEIKSPGVGINDEAQSKCFHPFIRISEFGGYCLADPDIPGVSEVYHGVLHFVVSGSRENTLFRMLIPIKQNT